MGEKLRRITLGSGRKLSRKDERDAEKSFCRRQVGEFMRGGAEGKKKPGQVGRPGGRGTTSLESGF